MATLVPASEGGSWRPARSPPPPAAAITARRDDRGRLDRRLADDRDSGWVRHDSEPRRLAVGQDTCS